LRERVGVARGKDLLQAGQWKLRLRGIERLAANGTDDAVELIADALQPGSAVRTDARTRLAAVRALAPHARQDEVRQALQRVLNGVRAGAPESELDVLARTTAALVLAKAGAEAPRAAKEQEKSADEDDPEEEGLEADDDDDDDESERKSRRADDDDDDDDDDAKKKRKRKRKPERPRDKVVTPLVAAVIGRGRTGELARAALLAYPPDSLRSFLRGKKKLSVAVIELLGDLGDVRAIGTLRRQMRRKGDRAKVAAVVALAKLGDGNAARHARVWLGLSSPRPNMRVAATEALTLLDTRDAPAAIAKLLAAAVTRNHGLRLAQRSLSPSLVPTLAAVVDAPVSVREKAVATAIIARIGGARAVPALLKLLSNPQLATSAAFGLASARPVAASHALQRALSSAGAGAPRRLVLRACLVRWLKLGQEVEGLAAALRAALGSKDPADRAVAAFGLAVLGRETVPALLSSAEAEVRYAAARAALALGPKAIAALTPALVKGGAGEQPNRDTVAAGLAMLVAPAAVSTTRLAQWAERGDSLSALAAYRLAARDSRSFRGRLKRLFEGSDATIRLHVAMGLALSPEPDAVSLLTDAYRFEVDNMVRRVIVRSLSVRSERLRLATLRLASELDPDPWARAMARSALAGRQHKLVLPPNGKEVAWISLRANAAEQRSRIDMREGQLFRVDGLSLPVISDPDGVLLVAGLNELGKVSFRVSRPRPAPVAPPTAPTSPKAEPAPTAPSSAPTTPPSAASTSSATPPG